MSTKYAIALSDTNERAGIVLENFLSNCRKFESLDVMGGARLFANYQKHSVRDINELSIIRSYFHNGYNMYLMTCFNEGPGDIPKNNAYHQNLAEINNVVVIANGNIKNKETIARQYEFSMGQSLQEYILGYYSALRKKFNNNFDLANMVKDIESEYLSFAIFDKGYNEIYLYNRGDILYMSVTPGINLVISSEILCINNVYPHYNFHKLPSNCALKIDTKTMFVQYIPIFCNTFSYGRNIMLDSNKALLFTENCDLEYYAALSLINTKEICNVNDIQTIFFGFNTDIDKLIFDKITKLRKSLKVNGKLPLHIQYNFNNIYTTESEIIEELNNQLIENKRLQEESIEDNPIVEKKIQTTTNVSLKDSSAFTARKLNYIANMLINIALEKGIGTIIIPNLNKHNNHLLSIMKSIIDAQVYTPLYIISVLDSYNTMDCIRYVVNCKEVHNADDILINCDRSSLLLELNDVGKPVLKYNVSSDYNYEMVCAFMKCGLDNPFSHRYVGKDKIDYAFANAGIVPDKIFNSERKAAFINNINTVTKNEIEYQKKLAAF